MQRVEALLWPSNVSEDVFNLGPSCWKQPNQRKNPVTKALDTRPHTDLALAAIRTLCRLLCGDTGRRCVSASFWSAWASSVPSGTIGHPHRQPPGDEGRLDLPVEKTSSVSVLSVELLSSALTLAKAFRHVHPSLQLHEALNPLS